MKRIEPPTIRPGVQGISRRMERAPTDLPHPDSPTMATVSPSPTLYEIPSTARTVPADVKKCVLRSRISSRLPTGPPRPVLALFFRSVEQLKPIGPDR